MPGLDFQPVQGTLSYANGPSGERVIEVAVVDDAVDEPDETFTLRLSDPQGSVLATATATIIDDDQRGVRVWPTGLTLDEQRTASYLVVLASEPTAAVTVRAQVLETAYAVSPERLTFTAADWARARRMTVTAPASASVDGTEIIQHSVSGGDYEGQSAAAVTLGGATQSTPTTGPALPAPALVSLQVDGAVDTMYPEFAAGVKHYAVRCDNPSSLDVTARTARDGVRMTLLRDDPTQTTVSLTGVLNAQQVDVSDDHDVAIELSDSHGTSVYVVHCIPADFPQISITSTSSASGGLLFATPGDAFMTILDYNGVPRFYREFRGTVFQRHADGPVIDGKRVHYSVIGTRSGKVSLLDAGFNMIREVVPVAPLTNLNARDFQITENGNFLFMSYHKTSRDITNTDPIWDPYRGPQEFEDSVIQEVSSTTGAAVFTWNAWDFLELLPDCERDGFLGDYGHLNSLQVVDDGDIVASIPGCSQVVRIDRSSGTWELEWKLGGTGTTRNPDTEYKEIVGDSAGHNEFCGQHQATLNRRNGGEVVLMYDNGNFCVGSRKDEAPFTRMVEYDISSQSQASVLNQYRLRTHTVFMGGVSMLDNGNWLIAWGGRSLDIRESTTISEVMPGGPDSGDATVVFELLMHEGDTTLTSYRVYHARETDVEIPLNLP